MSLPKTIKAVKCLGQSNVAISDVPLPQVKDDYVLVKVAAVGVNPTDWKHIHELPTEGTTVGCDYTGTVAAVGQNLTKQWAVGDRIAGVAHGMKKGVADSGCFAEYCLVKSGAALRVPPNVSDEEAATLGVAVSTIGHGLYQMLNLPWPDQTQYARTGTILIYGGSTATGLFAIQWARLSGFRVLATASPHSFDKVRSVGAEEVFDYHDADACIKQIRDATGGNLLYAFDCIAEGDSSRICASALSSEPGRAQYLAVLPYPEVRTHDDLWQKWLYAYVTLGEDFEDFGIQWPAIPQNYNYISRFWSFTEGVLRDGKLKLFPIPRGGGISEEGILAGLEELRSGKVSGGKLVYKI